MLRAITADYCGDGRSWTAEGTPLWWTDRRGLFPLRVQTANIPQAAPPTPNQIEAVWGTGGELLCLNEPRRTPRSNMRQETCAAPAVTRDVVRRGCLGPDYSGPRMPDCSAFTEKFWPFEPQAGPPAEFPTAYAVTVNWDGQDDEHGDYCNETGGQISWPP
jgi:hypothetical protein